MLSGYAEARQKQQQIFKQTPLIIPPRFGGGLLGDLCLVVVVADSSRSPMWWPDDP
jgi:hypothetical protein